MYVCSVENLFHQFIKDIVAAGWLEWVAVLSGILSVWFSKKEKVWVYPIGLINTLIYVYLSAKASLFGESMVNGYYTVMGIYGWWSWSRKDTRTKTKRLNIAYSTQRMLILQFLFFVVFFLSFFLILSFLKNNFYPGSVPWADSLATASAFTGMWLMTRKKIESWYWWMATNFISVPLYIYKGYALTGVYYVILFALAFAGLREWREKSSL